MSKQRLAELKERAHAQEAWGKWNMAPICNEIDRLEDEMRTPLHRAAHKAGYGLLIVLGCILAYVPIIFFAVKLFVGY